MLHAFFFVHYSKILYLFLDKIALCYFLSTSLDNKIDGGSNVKNKDYARR